MVLRRIRTWVLRMTHQRRGSVGYSSVRVKIRTWVRIPRTAYCHFVASIENTLKLNAALRPLNGVIIVIDTFHCMDDSLK